MKRTKYLMSASVLIFVLSVSALAGIIECPAPPPPPPAPASATAPGDIHIPGSPSDSATVAALNLLQNLLSVF
jgi:hypothetical protein